MRHTSLRLFLTVLAAGTLFGCGNDTGRFATKDAGSAPRGRLRVTGGKLLDGDSAEVVLKGLGFASISAAKSLGKWNEDYFANARAWNAELVRLPVNPADYRADPVQTVLDLDDALRWCQKHGMYLIIDYHVVGNVTQGLFQWEADLATTWPEIEAFWDAVSARYANEPTVAFYEIYNEPAALEYMGGSWSFADWKTHADRIVAILRKHAPQTIPVVGGLNWCYDLSAGGDRPFADPDIALSAHPYPGRAKTNRRAAWDAAFGYLSAHYPFILTEFGFDPNDQIEPYGTYRADISYGREILHYAQDKSMSWTPFVFFNAAGWPMPLFSDWETLTPTYSGQFFKDVLAGKDIDVAGTPAVDGGAADAPDAAGDAPEGVDGDELDAGTITVPGGVTVRLDRPRQIMEGFGISNTWAPALSDSEADALFDPSQGIGLSILRFGMNADGNPMTSNIYPDIMKAKARGVTTFIASALSAPVSCRASGHLATSCYDSWASTMAALPGKVRQATGAELYAMSAQNEPDYSSGDSSTSMLYSAAEMVAFTKVLAPKLKALAPPVKVIAPETTEWGRLWTNLSAPGASDPLSGKYDYGHALSSDPEAWAQLDILGRISTTRRSRYRGLATCPCGSRFG